MRAAIALVVIAACGRSSAAPPSPVVVNGGAPVSPLPALPPTETPAEAMGTLAADALGSARTGDLGALAGVMLQHASVTGRLDDYVEADRATARWIAIAPKSADAHLARAKVLGTLHRFADARRELARARALGANESTIALREIDLDQATGDLDRAIAGRALAWQQGPNLVSATMYALALAERGDDREALALMPRGLATWRDPSAIPFAWFLFQWARLAEERDDRVLARALYAEALRRVPRYGEAARHLAALDVTSGDDARAKQRLDALDAIDPHPETTAMRAEIALRTGDPRGPALRDAARAGWERYLAAYPDAFSDHAARFYLGVGGDPRRALALAETNVRNRHTAEALALAIEAALAADRTDRACELAAELAALGPAPERHRFTAWKAFGRCGRISDADRLGRELGL
ncbi:MAG TPA: hypothetical protein VL463_05885 [Kofleriaceae bacterium]|nr:hypothetical protein [Kofleriaceae bacterium]